jgi:hypothetical protein
MIADAIEIVKMYGEKKLSRWGLDGSPEFKVANAIGARADASNEDA